MSVNLDDLGKMTFKEQMTVIAQMLVDVHTQGERNWELLTDLCEAITHPDFGGTTNADGFKEHT